MYYFIIYQSISRTLYFPLFPEENEFTADVFLRVLIVYNFGNKPVIFFSSFALFEGFGSSSSSFRLRESAGPVCLHYVGLSLHLRFANIGPTHYICCCSDVWAYVVTWACHAL